MAGKDALYNFAVRRPSGSGVTGISVFYQDTAGNVFSYLFDFCAQCGLNERRLQLP